jgi:hypothetical protein
VAFTSAPTHLITETGKAALQTWGKTRQNSPGEKINICNTVFLSMCTHLKKKFAFYIKKNNIELQYVQV